MYVGRFDESQDAVAGFQRHFFTRLFGYRRGEVETTVQFDTHGRALAGPLRARAILCR
jgi:hypothetical protein